MKKTTSTATILLACLSLLIGGCEGGSPTGYTAKNDKPAAGITTVAAKGTRKTPLCNTCSYDGCKDSFLLAHRIDFPTYKQMTGGVTNMEPKCLKTKDQIDSALGSAGCQAYFEINDDCELKPAKQVWVYYPAGLFRALLTEGFTRFEFHNARKNGKPDIVIKPSKPDGTVDYFDLSTDIPPRSLLFVDKKNRDTI